MRGRLGTEIVSLGFTPSGMIRTWLDITGPDGITHGYGFYPTGNILDSPGEIKDDSQLRPVTTSGPTSITNEEYTVLMNYINRPEPTYSIHCGAQCTNWALAGLAEAELLPYILGPSMDGGLLQTIIYNPITQYLGFTGNETIEEIIIQFLEHQVAIQPLKIQAMG